MKLKNYFVSILIPLFVGCSTSLEMSKKEAEEYVDGNLEKIMLEMEKDYGLKHQEKPAVRVTDATEKGILNAKGTWIAKYNQYSDTITIYANNVWRQNEALDAEAMWNQNFRENYEKNNIETALRKTLTRYHMDKIGEELNGKSFPFYTIKMRKHDLWAITISIVGLTEEINSGGSKESINREDYSALENRLYAHIEGTLYMDKMESRGIAEELGRFIVHDLLKEYKEKLIIELVRNPPNWWEIMSPVGYKKTLEQGIHKQDPIKVPVN